MESSTLGSVPYIPLSEWDFFIRCFVDSSIVTTSKGKRGQTYHLTSTGHAQRKELAQPRIKEVNEEMALLKKEITVLKQEID